MDMFYEACSTLCHELPIIPDIIIIFKQTFNRSFFNEGAVQSFDGFSNN